MWNTEAIRISALVLVSCVHPQVHLLGPNHLSERLFVFLHHRRHHHPQTTVPEAAARNEEKNHEANRASELTEACRGPARHFQNAQTHAAGLCSDCGQAGGRRGGER